jgi:hypothetical protein
MTAPRYTLEFNETGGYDCMTGAWIIRDTARGQYAIAVTIDQDDYGQEYCDYSFRSAEADRVAKICLEALNQAPQ